MQNARDERATVGKVRAPLVNRILQWSSLAGFSPYQLATLRRMPQYLRELKEYRRQASGTPFDPSTGPLAPALSDYDAPAGIARGHYFHQDLWAARRIFDVRPSTHVDVGSRIDGFAAHVLTFMPLTIVDIRPLESFVEGLTFLQGDATNLHAIADDSLESLSSLHAIEHIGLGRYRDRIDADGWRAAAREFARVLAPHGRLYLSVPVGRERVEFNSHRVFAPKTIIDAFLPLQLVAFNAVDDRDVLHLNAEPANYAASTFSCGMFEFVKR
jgi:SAM-dependent methyltransferase